MTFGPKTEHAILKAWAMYPDRAEECGSDGVRRRE